MAATRRKLLKLRTAPLEFFADSSSGVLRGVGYVASPLLARSELLLNALEDPLQVLRDSPLVPLVRGYERRRRRRRLAALARAGQPAVSVIMAARNAAATIDDAIGSVLGQTYRELELIVVDDASDDDTPARARAWADRDPRVRLVSSSLQRGAGLARNLGLASATGAYLAFHDADDRAHPERFERQLGALVHAPGAAVCICNFRRELADGRRVTVNGRRFAKNALSMVFPRDPVFRRLGYFMDIKIAEDTEYYERIRAVFGRDSELHLFETLYWARFDPSSLLFADSDTVFDARRCAVSFERSEAAMRDYEAIYERMDAIRAGSTEPWVGVEGR